MGPRVKELSKRYKKKNGRKKKHIYIIIESDFVNVLGDVLHTWTDFGVTFGTSES